jgi:hypothetical protein
LSFYFNIGSHRSLPDAASPALEISGRVLTPDGRGLRNVVVTLTGSNGVERTVTISSFGYYHFDSLTGRCDLHYRRPVEALQY